jgi:hypothetical protein
LLLDIPSGTFESRPGKEICGKVYNGGGRRRGWFLVTVLWLTMWIMELYSRYKDNPQIKLKDSIKKVVGLELPAEQGLDV